MTSPIFTLEADETRTWCGLTLTFDPADPASEQDVISVHESTCPDCLTITAAEGDVR